MKTSQRLAHPVVLLLLFPVALAAQPADDGSSADLESIIKSYEPTANKIIRAARAGNDSYLKLQELCDDIGHRLSGSESLAEAIEWAQMALKRDGQENVRAEPVMVRKWVRGAESCQLVEPRPMRTRRSLSSSPTVDGQGSSRGPCPRRGSESLSVR